MRSTTNNTTPSAAPRPSDNSQNVGLTPAPGRPSALSALTTATGIGGLLNWSRARTNDGVFANVQASADASKPEEHLPVSQVSVSL